MLRICTWVLFALIAVGCAPPAKVKVVMRLRPDQEPLYRTRILKPFEKKNNCIVELHTYSDPATLPELLSSTTDTFDLVDPPTSMTRTLVSKNLIAPLDEMVQPKELGDLRREFFLMDLTSIRGQAYFLPRYLETPVIVYLKSQVAEAVQFWELRKDEINQILVKYNGKGLPRSYMLEKDPGQWDNYDMFVAGYYWSQKEVKGQKHGRIALGAIGSPTYSQSLMDKCYQAGATQDGILRMNDDAVVDMFQWQSVLIKEGVLNPELLKAKWSESEIRQGFQSGDIFLAEATQMEAFMIHGTGTPEMPGYLNNPEDMGIALMPRGNSLTINPHGEALREGRRSVGTRGWWWGVTRLSRNKDLAYRLAHHLSSTGNQIEECSAFGMVPVRQDLLGELGLMFGGGWTSDLFQTASQQLVENRFTVVPLVEEFADISRNYSEAYQELCLPGGSQKTQFEDLQKTLEARYIPRQKQVLGPKYPSRVLSSR